MTRWHPSAWFGLLAVGGYVGFIWLVLALRGGLR